MCITAPSAWYVARSRVRSARREGRAGSPRGSDRCPYGQCPFGKRRLPERPPAQTFRRVRHGGTLTRAIPVPEEDSMPQYLSPGVYVEEKEAGSRPIEGVGTAIAAFVGVAADGPFNEPTLVTNWSQFTSTFGGFVPGSYLAHSVYGYLNNGGGACYVVRIGQDGGAPAARA